MADLPFQVQAIAVSDAGKDRFSERLYVSKFLRQVELRTVEKEWYVCDGRAWIERKAASYEPLVLSILPEAFKTEQNISKMRGVRLMEPSERAETAE